MVYFAAFNHNIILLFSVLVGWSGIMFYIEFSIPYSASDFTEQTEETERGIKHGVVVLLGISPSSTVP